MLNRRYQLLLLAVLLLTAFYPTNFAEVNSIDDREMIAGLQNLGDWRLYDLFFPSAAEGYYYRPLLILSYYLDKEVWSLSSSVMHLENVLLHLLNAFLVFTFARNLLPEADRQSSYAPLVAALCFALHPLAVEPVSWICGRTDLLAGTFVLMSAVMLLKFKEERKKIYGVLTLIALLFGMMSKEVALGFFPGAFLLLIAKHADQQEAEVISDRFWTRAKKIAVYLMICAGVLLIFFGLRTLAFTSTSPKISMTLKFMFNDLNSTLFVFLRAFGFYLKKLYWPFPLNFAIIEIDPLYELLAIPLILFCCWMASRRTLVSATFIAGLFLILPALPIAFNQIAWTPYAERYIYVTSAFVLTASVFYFREQLKNYHDSLIVKLGTLSLLIFLGVTTFQRNMVMQTNLALYTDTVKKSPDFNVAWNQLGLAYYNKHDLRNAEKNFRKASLIYSFSYDEIFDLNLAQVLCEQGKYDEAAEVYAKVFKNNKKSQRAAKSYEEFLQKRNAATPKKILSASSVPNGEQHPKTADNNSRILQLDLNTYHKENSKNDL